MHTITYDDVINGADGYEFKYASQEKMNELSFDNAVGILSREITTILQADEDQNKIIEFKFGETYVRNLELDPDSFRAANDKSWDRKGIKDIYYKKTTRDHYQKLFVLYFVDQNSIPNPEEGTRENDDFNFYNYALDVRHRLTYIFTFEKGDKRIRRGTQEAKPDVRTLKGAVVYVAFKLREDATQQSGTPTNASSGNTGSGNSHASGPSQHSEAENTQELDSFIDDVGKIDINKQAPA